MITTVIYPHGSTIFAAACACIFTVVGILGNVHIDYNTDAVQLGQEIILIIVENIIGLLLGNLITILALLRCPKLRSHATTAFVLSLCISDLLFCSISLPLTAIRFINKAWTLGDTLCKLFPVLFYGNVAVSLLSMVGITLNRYILIAYHSLYSKIYQWRYICLQLVFVWIVSFSIMLPPLLETWGQLGLDEPTFSCTILKKDGTSPKKIIFLIGFVIPCLVIIISYSCIYWTVRRQRMKLIAHSGSSKSSGYGGYSVRDREDCRLTAMMLLIFLCFIVCFLPLMLVNVADDDTAFPWIHVISSVMAWASSVINPFIYAASNRSYRVAYYKMFSIMKFWGQPLTPMASKSLGASKGSRDLSNGQIKSNSNGGIIQNKLSSSPLDIKNGILTHL